MVRSGSRVRSPVSALVARYLPRRSVGHTISNMDYKATWRERTRSWAIELLGGRCVDCGTMIELDFDHIDSSTKSFDISVGIRDGYSRARLQMELLKCQLLCNPCHIEKSIEYMDGRRVEHGGGRRGKRNCKCDPCRLKYNEYMRELKQAKRAAVAQQAVA